MFTHLRPEQVYAIIPVPFLHYLLSNICSFTLAPVFSVLDHISCYKLVYLLRFCNLYSLAIHIFFTALFKLVHCSKITYCTRCISFLYATITDVCICVLCLHLILHPLSDLFSDSFWDEWKRSRSFLVWVFSFCLSFHCTFFFFISYFLYFLTSLLIQLLLYCQYMGYIGRPFLTLSSRPCGVG